MKFAILLISVSVSLLSADVFAVEPEFRIVGYLPEYRVADLDREAIRSLTDLIFFSVFPEAAGKFGSQVLDDPATQKLLKEVREQKIRLHLCVGGWDRSKGFPELAETADSRQQFAAGALAFCREHEFAGIDLDWEHPADEAQQTNYGLLLQELARVFHAEQKEVSLAMAGWQQLSDKAFESVDGVNLMSYDGPGRHATFEQAVQEIESLRKRKVPAAKIRLGVPFYGRGIQDRDKVLTYSQILQQHRPKPAVNEVADLFYNGPELIRKKTKWARGQKLGGIMIWEIGQDARGKESLLGVIRQSSR